MIDAPDLKTTTSAAASGLPALPRWARMADLLTVALAVCGIAVALTGGFHLHAGGVRISMTSPWRALVLALVVTAVRHAACRHPSLPERLLRAAALAVRPDIWPVVVRVLAVALFLWSVGRFYTPQAGFTRLIVFGQDNHPYEMPALRQLPHWDELGSGYDGQFYAQIALDPLLRSRAINGAVDNPPYRARRIVMPWVASVLGLGRPSAVIQAYALINVLTWLLFAWYLYRRVRAPTGRALAVWIGCLFCHGMLASVRMALPDGPSILAIALAIGVLERRGPLPSSAAVGLAVLLRETNVLAFAAIVGDALTRPFASGAIAVW